MFASVFAHAQTYPSKPITFIAPYTPGGTADLLARVIGKALSDRWGQPVIIDNRVGASGMIGTKMLAAAPADGYTIGLAVFGTHAANVGLYPRLPYDPIKDFTPISLAVSAPMILLAHPSIKVGTVNELIARAKAEPGLTYASGGAGSSPHIGMEMFARDVGIKLNHVPYKGSGGAYVDVISGRVPLIFDVVPTALPHIKSGKVVPVAVGSPTRLPFLPGIPTVAESGVPGFEFSGWFGIAGPANLPNEILSKLHAGITEALRSEEVKAKLIDAGLVVVASTPDQFSSHIKSEIRRLSKVIKDANISVE